MSTITLGVTLRGFASKPESVEKTVAGVKKTLLNLATVASHDEFNPTVHVYIAIPVNKGFVDADCGELAPALRALVETSKFEGITVEVHETNADLFCGLLNQMAGLQLQRGCTHTLVISTGCADYITLGNMKALMKAFRSGARAAGLALNELEESIMDGRLANTFAGYDILSLLTVGGFDFRCSNAPVSDHKKLAGVEEIPTLLRLANLYGACIKPIMPEIKGTWVLPTDPAELERHNAKMASKFKRQTAFAEQLGCTFADLEVAVMAD
ncbi:MAG: hypothetical protein AAB610_02995 [Patescibacteria group bacterium]